MAKKFIKIKEKHGLESVQWDGSNLAEIETFLAPGTVVETSGKLIITDIYGDDFEAQPNDHIIKKVAVTVTVASEEHYTKYYEDK